MQKLSQKKNNSKKKLSNELVNCLCGGVKFKINGNLRHVHNCHCSQCMKTHGNYSSYTQCLDKELIFINKNTLKWFKSSKIAKRGFCNKCGASIFYKKYKSKHISIAAGMLNNPTNLKTYCDIFTKDKLDYYKLNNKLKRFSKASK